MSESNGNRVWLKILGSLIPLLITGAIGYGVLKADVDGLRRDVDTKAAREVVTAQYESLLRELQAIRADVAELKRRP